jgi:hypothetical protein
MDKAKIDDAKIDDTKIDDAKINPALLDTHSIKLLFRDLTETMEERRSSEP